MQMGGVLYTNHGINVNNFHYNPILIREVPIIMKTKLNGWEAYKQLQKIIDNIRNIDDHFCFFS